MVNARSTTSQRSGDGTDRRRPPARQALADAVALATATGRIVKDVDRSLSGYHGIGFSDLRLLLELQASPDGRLQRVELAERLGVTTSGVARQLAPLERIGLVDRERHATDARLAIVVLTPAGDELAGHAAATADEAAERGLDRIWSRDERAALRALLAT